MNKTNRASKNDAISQNELNHRDEVIERHLLNWMRSHQALLTRETLRAFFNTFREERSEFEHPKTLIHFRCVERGVESVELFEQHESSDELKKAVAEYLTLYYPGDNVRTIQTIDFENTNDEELNLWINSFWSTKLLLPQHLKEGVAFISPISRGEMELEIKEEIHNKQG